MSKQVAKFGSTIPELSESINKFGCGLGSSPPYIVLGQYNSSKQGPISGILAATQNEFYAHLICREVNKNGTGTVERTEYHEKPTFSITIYKDKLRERLDAIDKAKQEEELATARRAQYPAPRIVSWGGQKE